MSRSISFRQLFLRTEDTGKVVLPRRIKPSLQKKMVQIFLDAPVSSPLGSLFHSSINCCLLCVLILCCLHFSLLHFVSPCWSFPCGCFNYYTKRYPRQQKLSDSFMHHPYHVKDDHSFSSLVKILASLKEAPPNLFIVLILSYEWPFRTFWHELK